MQSFTIKPDDPVGAKVLRYYAMERRLLLDHKKRTDTPHERQIIDDARALADLWEGKPPPLPAKPKAKRASNLPPVGGARPGILARLFGKGR